MHTPTIIIIVLFHSFFFIRAQNDWQYVKTKKGVVLFQRDYGNNGIKEFRAESVMKNINYHSIVAMFRDHERFDEWVKDMKVVKNIKSNGPNENFDYYEVNIPWPFENRDIVYFQKIFYGAEDKSLNIVFKGFPDMIPPTKNKIRMRESFGGWKFYRKGGELHIIYQHYTDPNNLPANLVNIFIPDGVIETILRFKAFAASNHSRYQNAHYSFIKE